MRNSVVLPAPLGPDLGGRRSRWLAELKDVEPAGDFCPHRLVSVGGVAALVDIAELHGVADAQAAAVGLLLAGDHAEQRGLAGAVGADDADDGARRNLEAEVVDQQLVAEGLADVLRSEEHTSELQSLMRISYAVFCLKKKKKR